MPERVRFSPAPTGRLHLGGARTALFNDLVARNSGGDFILRFEDTDVVRSDTAHEAGLIEDLAWLGLRWSEGPDVGGPHAPYRQSERGALYADALERLVDAGRVYRCFCGEETLARDREADAAEGRSPRYSGACRHLTPAESASLTDSGAAHCWRFAVGEDRDIVVDDRVHGPVTFRTGDIGDFVVVRSDGAPLYDLACAVDDVAMGVTLVIRGDDHLSNTPRQMMLIEALGSSVVPVYAHVPLVMGADGRPLSKSRGAEAVSSLREQGFLPEAVVNHLALLGWSDPDGREVMDAAAIASAFDLSRVSGSAPVHDPARLRWLNGRHMALLSAEERAAVVAAHMPDLPGIDRLEAAALVAGEVEVAGDAAALLAGVAAPLPPDDEAAAALASPVASRALELAASALSGGGAEALRPAIRDAGLSVKDAFPALRAALTGRGHGLPISTLVALIGAAESVRRLRYTART